MTLKELELFYLLCDDPHISQLAKKLSISQSAISLSIKSLEKKLQEPLFDRLGKKLMLNERGRLFKEQTYPHFLALKDAKDLFTKDKLSGILKVASSKTLGEFIIPQIIFEFAGLYPNVNIQKDIKNSSQIISMVQSGEIDLGIIESECNEPNIKKEKIGEDNLVVVTSDKTLSNKELYIDTLSDRKWILRESGSGTRELFLKTLGNLKKELNIVTEFTEFEEMKTLLEKNRNLLSCISKFVVSKDLKRGDLFTLKLKNIDLKRELFIIYHKDKYQTSLFNSFKEYIKKNFQG
ncbi:MAG: LysR family transcriptional regulator [Sulfurospirillum sp.]|nr:MAG: LysR family transcriptional regulator [Sulfurospirillum sp.]